MMKTKLTQLLRSYSRRSLCARLTMLTALVICGVNSAWGDGKTLPYTYGFENNNLSNEGWTKVDANTGSYSTNIAYSSYTSRTGTYYFRFYSNENPPQYLISPLLADSDAELVVSFYYRNAYASNTESFSVGYSTDNLVANFTWKDEVACNSTTYSKCEYTFPAHTRYIAIKSTTTTSSSNMGNNYYLCIDDVKIEENNPYKVPSEFSVSDVAATTANLSWENAAGSSPTSWQVKYKTSSFTPTDDSSDEATLVDEIATNSYTLTDLTPESTYYVFVRACYSGGNSEWVQVSGNSFTTLELYPKPTGFKLNSVAAETATFSWNNGAGTTPTSWQIKYSETSGFDPDETGSLVDNITSRSKTVTGLTENTTYYARVRAYYGDSHYSPWNVGEVTFKPTSDIVVNDGTVTSSSLPFRGGSVDTDTRSQTIITASKLTAVRNRQIRKLIFYSSTYSADFGTATFDVYLKETSKANIPSAAFDNVMGTKVLTNASLSIVGGQMEVDFEVPFNYTNGNLMVTFRLNATGTTKTVNFYSLYTNKMSYYENNGTGYTDNYSPKMTIVSRPTETSYVKIGATGYTTFASKWKLDLDNLPDGLTAYYAATGAVDGSLVHFTPATGITAANEGLLLKGTAGTVYAIPTSNSSATFKETNLLKGVGPLETALDVNKTSGNNNYVLVNNSGTAEFQSLADHGATIPGGKAYLQNGSYSGARALSIVFDDEEATGITDVRSKKEDVRGEYYDLQGRKVAQPTKGLYIVNGRKVVK